MTSLSYRKPPLVSSLFIAEGIRLKSVQLDALGVYVPESGLNVVLAYQPDQVRRKTPVRVFAKRRTANTKIAVAPVGPVGKRNQKTTILVDVSKP